MSDEQLIRERFREFYQQNSARLLSFAFTQATPDYPAEDLLQDAVISAWRRLDPASCNNWWSWICSIIVHRRIDRHWKRKEAPIDPTDHLTTTENAVLTAGEACETPSPSELAEHSDNERIVRQAVANMKNEQQRRVLELYYFDDGNYPTLKEVAAAMNISHCNAKKLHERGKEALKQSLRQLAQEMYIPTKKANP